MTATGSTHFSAFLRQCGGVDPLLRTPYSRGVFGGQLPSDQLDPRLDRLRMLATQLSGIRLVTQHERASSRSRELEHQLSERGVVEMDTILRECLEHSSDVKRSCRASPPFPPASLVEIVA